jgi:hypothetical protein
MDDGNVQLENEIDHPGFSDMLVHISHNPALFAVQQVIREQVFGRWRRGCRAGLLSNSLLSPLPPSLLSILILIFQQW